MVLIQHIMIHNLGTRKYENKRFENYGNTAIHPRVSHIEHSSTNSYQLIVEDGNVNWNAKF